MQPTTRVGVIGTGHFATAVLTQSGSIADLQIAAVADLNPEAARHAFRLAGVAEDALEFCESRAAALAALERGQRVIVEDALLLMELPLDVIVESTGVPEAGAVHARAAIAAGKHVAMVTKETDSVVGPMLAHLARQAGVSYTAVDGDQHGLLIELVRWCRGLGLEVLAAGKARDGDYFYDRTALEVNSGEFVLQLRSRDSRWLAPLRPLNLAGLLQERMDFLAPLPGVGGWDLTEPVIAANALDLRPDDPFDGTGGGQPHGPALYTTEIPGVFCPWSMGGILENRGVIDIVTSLRIPEAAGLGGGVFAVVHAHSDYSRQILATKGCLTNPAGDAALLYRPYHLCGVETPVTLLAAAQRGHSAYDSSYWQAWDVVMVARRDLAAGETLGTDHSPDVEALMAPVQSIHNDAAWLPIHLGSGHRLRVDVPEGAPVPVGAVERPSNSVLWALRAEQEKLLGIG
ncbi:MAG: hypothetical protein WAU10_16640 [Caldilineaceae bacterium]